MLIWVTHFESLVAFKNCIAFAFFSSLHFPLHALTKIIIFQVQQFTRVPQFYLQSFIYDLVLNVHFCRKQTFLQKRTLRTRSAKVLNVPFCRKYFCLQKRTFRSIFYLVLNVLFCRKYFFLQKRTFRPKVDLVLNVPFCRKQTLLQKRTFRPPHFFLNFAN